MLSKIEFFAMAAFVLLACSAQSGAQGIGSNVPLKGTPAPEYNDSGKLIRTVQEDQNGTRFITEYGADGKVASRRVELSKDPKVRARLEEQEKSLIAAADAAKDNGSDDGWTPNDKMEKLDDLASFYLFTVHDIQKAAATVAKMPVEHTYGLHVQLIFYDFSLTPEQRVAAYKKLLDLYPDNKKNIEGLIKIAETDGGGQ